MGAICWPVRRKGWPTTGINSQMAASSPWALDWCYQNAGGCFFFRVETMARKVGTIGGREGVYLRHIRISQAYPESISLPRFVAPATLMSHKIRGWSPILWQVN